MGGYGSGRSRTTCRKTVVEDCVHVSSADLPPVLNFGEPIRINLRCHDGLILGYQFFQYEVLRGGLAAITSEVKTKDGTVKDVVPVLATAARSGGERNCFGCPLWVGGQMCLEPCRKLYCPPASDLFGCRNCHQLVYASSQNRDRRWARTDAEVEKLMIASGDMLARLRAGEDAPHAKWLQLWRRLCEANRDEEEWLLFRRKESGKRDKHAKP